MPPIVADVLEYRQLAKLKSTYADGLAACIAADGRIHSNFNQTITATRTDQQYGAQSPEHSRADGAGDARSGRFFVPKEGCLFIDADYSQIELRVLAHLSGG